MVKENLLKIYLLTGEQAFKDAWIHFHITDEKGKKMKFEAHGFFARVIQHEVDHLDGILFVDRTKEIFKEENEKN